METGLRTMSAGIPYALLLLLGSNFWASTLSPEPQVPTPLPQTLNPKP